MNRIRTRIANRNTWLPVFVLIVFIVYAWSIVTTLQQIPAWILRTSIWDLIGDISYLQLFALIESILMMIVVFTLGLFLPKAVYEEKFAALGGAFILVASGWAAGMHLAKVSFTGWGPVQFLGLAAFFGLSATIGIIATWKIPALQKGITALSSRLSILSYIYFGLSLVGVLIVIIRNISGALGA